MKVRLRLWAIAGLVLLIFSGCSQQSGPTGSDGRDKVRPEILSAAIHSDAAIAATPRDRFEGVDVVAVGQLVAFGPGPTVRTPDDAGAGFIADRFVLARVEVSTWIKGRDGGSTLLVALPSGAETVNADLSPRMEPGTRSPVIALERFRESIPKGTHVVVMANVFHPERYGPSDVTLYDMPQGKPVMNGLHPQAMSVEDDDGSMSGWPGYTFPTMTEALSSSTG